MTQPFSFGTQAKPTCENCGATLVTAVELREGFCSQLKCRGPCLKRMGERARAQKARERQRRDQLADDVRSVLRRELSETWTNPDSAVLVVVPGVDAAVVEVPAERIETLRSHLGSAMTAAENEIQNPQNGEALDVMHQDRDVYVVTALPVINACSTCRGQCCLQGGDHAFLNRDFLAWRLLNEPDQTPQNIIDDYIRRLPSHALEGSCLYHTSAGCALPRQIRSSTCNEFVCTGISDVCNQWYDRPEMASVAACVNSGICGRVGLMSSDSHRSEIEIHAPIGADRSE